jgi:hypothetical protein
LVSFNSERSDIIILNHKDLFESDSTKGDVNFNSYFVDEFDAFCEVLCSYLPDISCYMKNPAFAEEDEVRIRYSPLMSTDLMKEEFSDFFKKQKKFGNYVLNPIDYYSSSNKIIGYADLNFDKLIEKGIISEIYIGPSSTVTEEDIFFFLIKYGYEAHEIKIINSKASYRIK